MSPSSPLPLIAVLNGPNLNMLGVRQPEVYGKATLADVESLCRATAEKAGLQADCRQSNDEGQLIGWAHEARQAHSAIVINAGGYSHTSVALRDALTLTELPVVEIHITNIHAREEFRHVSLLSGVAKAVICGCGVEGYRYAMETAVRMIEGRG